MAVKKRDVIEEITTRTTRTIKPESSLSDVITGGKRGKVETKTVVKKTTKENPAKKKTSRKKSIKKKSIKRKAVKNKTIKRKSPKKKAKRKTSLKQEDKLIKELVGTNIILQDKTIDLVSNIKKLNERLDKMVSLFEQAARHITSEMDGKMEDKLEKLIDQNRIIANGLIILEKYIKDKNVLSENKKFSPKPLNQGF